MDNFSIFRICSFNLRGFAKNDPLLQLEKLMTAVKRHDLIGLLDTHMNQEEVDVLIKNNKQTFKGTLRWSDKNWYIIYLDPMITLVGLKILNSSIFTLKSGLKTQFLVLLCVLNASIFILLCVSNASIFFRLPKNLSAILTVLEQLLVVREITIQSKFKGRKWMKLNFLNLSLWSGGLNWWFTNFYLIAGVSL